MGCDIHVHVEIKRAGQQTWQHWAMPESGRHYVLFGIMAGVRGSQSDVLPPPRGLPDDIALPTERAVDDWAEDAHSHSWLGIEELKQVEHEYADYADDSYDEDDEFNMMKTLFGWNTAPAESLDEYIKTLPDDLRDMRFVFWFDS